MIGETVGSYRILSRLGEGGMGVVYLAEHPLIGRKAAVKMILPDLSRSEMLVKRFFNEARAAALLKHPGLVDVFDFGQHPNGSAYIVMEYLEGESLADRVKREGRLPAELVVAIVRQVAAAVGAAHQKGIIHRDLKPENLFLVSDPESPLEVRAKVLDFGLAKLATEDGPGSVKTRTGAIFGTPQYMAPEQCRGSVQVDHRADIYALGCIFYELCTGQLPFTHQGTGDLIAAHIHETPLRPSQVEPGLAPEIEAVIEKTIAKRVDERYQTMAELGKALDELWTGPRPAATRSLITPPRGTVLPSPSSSPTAVAAPTLPVAAEISPSLPSVTRRSRTPWVIGALLLLGGAGAAGWWFMKAPPAPAPAAAPAAAPAPAPTPAPAPAPAPVASPPPPQPPPRVTLVIDSLPHAADVYREADGVKLGKTPLTRQLEAVDGEAVFIVKLPGYREERVSLRADRDGQVKARLKRAPRAAKKAPGGPTVLDPYE